MELNEILLRCLKVGDEGTHNVILGGIGHITEQSYNRPVLRRSVTDMSEVSLKTLSKGLSHSLHRSQRSIHGAKVRHGSHRRTNSARVHKTHIHVVFTHHVTKRFSISSKGHLRRTVDRIHGLSTETGTRGEDSDLTRTTLLHTRQKREDGIQRSVNIRGVDFASSLD